MTPGLSSGAVAVETVTARNSHTWGRFVPKNEVEEHGTWKEGVTLAVEGGFKEGFCSRILAFF